MNPAAERLTGTVVDPAEERTLEQVVGFVDENDRRLLSDPLRQALTSGAAVNLSRRALLLSRANGAERSIELSAAPIRNEANESDRCSRTAARRDRIARACAPDVLSGDPRCAHRPHQSDATSSAAARRQSIAASAATASMSLCYLDLDRFKAVNDTSGHLAGDSMLREVAKLLRDAVRDSDTVGRLVAMSSACCSSAARWRKRSRSPTNVCRSVGDYRFVWKDKIFNIGVSVGIVEIFARERHAR